MNFLIKNGYAVQATQTGVKRLQQEQQQNALEEKLLIEECKKEKQKLEKLTLVFKVKAGNGGRVFGSVSPKQITSELKNKGFDIDKKKIKSEDSLTSLGFHNVEIELHKQVKVNLKVQLVEEGR